jgi:reactive chlorine resistance protein C
MTTPAKLIRLQIAEKSAGSVHFLALLRWALVIIFLWVGGMKFTAYEAAGIAPFVEHSPFMSWLHVLFGIQGASDVIGVIELSTAAALILGAFQPTFSALGAAMSAATYLITLTFFLSTPGVAEATAGGFPAISAAPGQFLLKDLVLLAASLSLLFASVPGPWLNVQKSRDENPLFTDRIGEGEHVAAKRASTTARKHATPNYRLR